LTTSKTNSTDEVTEKRHLVTYLRMVGYSSVSRFRVMSGLAVIRPQLGVWACDFLQQSDYPCPRVPALWHPPPSPENKIARDLLRILAHVAAKECPVAGRSLNRGLSAVCRAEIRFVELID
jgi:hypothetical protein